MATVDVNGLTIAYDLEGDGPQTIVLVNGLADDRTTWALQMPALVQAGYRVLSFDNRGVGESGKPQGPYTTAQMAADARGLVEALDIGEHHLLGVSMGGMIAQEYALARPDGLRSLTLACTYAAPGPFCSRMFALWADMARDHGVPFVMRDVLLWAFTLDFFEGDQTVLAETEAGLEGLTQPLEAYLGQLSSIQTHDTTARLSEIDVPTHVVAGEQDILIPTELSRRISAAVPGATWTTVPGGHACMWEHPEPFNEAVIAYLCEHGS